MIKNALGRALRVDLVGKRAEGSRRLQNVIPARKSCLVMREFQLRLYIFRTPYPKLLRKWGKNKCC